MSLLITAKRRLILHLAHWILLSRLPNGVFVKNIPENLTALSAQLPQHPYSIMGAERVLAKAQDFEN